MLVFSQDGSRLLSFSSNKLVVYWDLKTGLEAGRLRFDWKVTAATLSLNNKFLAIGTNEPAVLLWNMDSAVHKSAAREIAGRNALPADWNLYPDEKIWPAQIKVFGNPRN